MQKFFQLLEDEFKVTFQRMQYRKAETDGFFIHLGGMLVNVEVKNELGLGGGAIHVKNAAYVAAHAFQAKKIRGKSICPTLLIELAGPNMSLSGAVYTDMALCDQLSPMVSLLWQPHSRLMVQAAKCFAAIRKALPSLRSFYEALDKQAMQQQELTRQLENPYATSFIGSQGSAQPLYNEKLSRTCFKAPLDSQEGLVLVKFCKSYSKDAHICLSSHGYAPNLVAMASLTDGWLMVIMEFVNMCLWDEAPKKPVAALEAAVHLLHQAGFVHGDLRSNNIFVLAESVRVIDFEWAGVVGQSAYPLFMNHTDLTWLDGARDGQPIKQEHDLYWLKLLCDQAAASLVAY